MSVPYYQCETLKLIPHIRHGFFSRQGGVSQGYFGSLNTTSDRNDNQEHVLENRHRVCQALGRNKKDLILAIQCHSKIALTVSKPFETEIPEGDALITTTPGLLIAIQTADCVPILIADKTKPIVAAVHAGWKGAVAGIIKETVNKLVNMGSDPTNLAAAIGPCIWQESYEVQTDVVEQVNNPKFFMNSINPGKYMFDLPGFVFDQLKQQGIQDISPSPANTYTNKDSYFSFRRKTHNNEPVTGNQISVIGIY